MRRPHLSFDIHTEINEVFIHSFLFNLGVKLVAIFIPLFLLDIGLDPIHVVIYYLLYYTIHIIAAVPNAWVVSRFGYKSGPLLGTPLILGYYLILRALEAQPTFPGVVGAGIVGGLGFSLYWAGMNAEVSYSSHDEDHDSETGLFFSMPSLASAAAPMIGGLIILFGSYNLLYGCAFILVALSFLPFVFADRHVEGHAFSAMAAMDRAHLVDALTYLYNGIESIGRHTVWPLYLAVVIGGSATIGGAGSVLSLGSAVASIAVGHYATPENRSRFILLGGLLTAGSYIAMLSVTGPVLALLVAAWNGLAYNLINVPVYSTAIERAEETGLLSYFAMREMALSVGRVLVLAVLGGLILADGAVYLIGFGLVAMGILGKAVFARRLQERA